MVKTASSMLPLGTRAPDFQLFDPSTKQIMGLNSLTGNVATVIMFICNHCPYVIHVAPELARLANEYMEKGVSFVGINSNDAQSYPEDSPEKMVTEVKNRGYSFPYLYDETQVTAKAYHAECTPDFFVFDKQLKCAYRGQLDDSRPGNQIALNGQDLRAALDCLIRGVEVDPDQKPSVGCNIKWKKS